MKRTAKAHWEGKLQDGNGSLDTQSGVMNRQKYSYKTRFENEQGTNPEELLAAAEAGCFTMAVSMELGEQGYDPNSLDTEATLTMEDLAIKGIHLDISGKVPGISESDFRNIAENAAKHCIVSRALDVEITSNSRLV